MTMVESRFHRTEAVMQQMLDQAQANVYYSDALVTYGAGSSMLVQRWHIRHARAKPTRRVNGAPLSGSLGAAFALLFALPYAAARSQDVYAWNQRQLYRQKYPHYATNLIQFLSPSN